MSRLVFLFSVSSTLLFLSSSWAFSGEVLPRLNLKGDSIEGRGRLTVHAEALPIPFSKLVVQSTEEEVLVSKVEKLERDLWLLVDTSRLCINFGLEVYFDQLIPQLKKLRAESSRVSFVEYTAGQVSNRFSQRPLEELSHLKLNCQKTAMSTSYEEALRLLMNQNANRTKAVDVWVFTSGNVSITEDLAAEIRKSGLRVFLGVYNPHILSAIESTLENLPVEYGLVRDGEKKSYLPDSEFTVNVELPESDSEGSVSLKLLVLDPSESPLAEAGAVLQIPQTQWQIWWKTNGRAAILFSLGVVAVFACILGLRLFRRRRCRKCRRFIERKSGFCFFCQEDGVGYLMRLREGDEDLLPILKDGLTIGSKRSSKLRIPSLGRPGARPGLKRKESNLYQIKAARLRDGKKVFRLIRLDSRAQFFVTVNGRPITSERLIGNGDLLEIRGEEYRFVYEEGKRHA